MKRQSTFYNFICAAGIGLLLLVTGIANADQPDKTGIEFFELNIRPVLIEKCNDCHTGEPDAESGMSLDSRESLLKGGDYGPAIVPGKPGQSLLIQVIQQTHKELRMPPEKGDKLSAKTIANFRRWIEQGAPWPKENTAHTTNAIRSAAAKPTSSHWFFQPRQTIQVPAVENQQWAESPIDQFVYTKLQEQKLEPVELASRRMLIRRATFDLTGLPPTQQEVEQFVNDPLSESPAFAKVVDRLLASPAYGQRWGRHWLDVARYADTQGDTGDFPIPGAYLYRNWVIDSLNADMPYDKFLQAQLAGDILSKHEADPDYARQLRIATGFIAISRRFGNTRYKDQYLTIDNMLDTLGRGVMGVTLRCARCHDHKFDPILATDYYGLYGIFDSTRFPSMGASNDKSPVNMVAASGRVKSQQALDEHWKIITRYQYQIRNHFRPWLKPTLDEYKEVVKELKQATEQGQPTEKLEARRVKLLASRGGKFRDLMEFGLDWLNKKKAQLISDAPPDEMLYAVMDGVAHNSKLHRRGDPKNLGEEVPRQFLSVISDSDDKVSQAASGREELARWLTAPDHPLTARVIVNRLWHHHFGRGIVKTVDNLGVQGELPTHPQLLDFLANRLVADGWSLKSMHRFMMTSRTYRLASSDTQANRQRDPNNIFLWKFSRRRLDAESIRDAMLMASGQLDLSPGKAHPFPTWDKNRSSLNAPFHVAYPSQKRSVYLITQRLFKHPFLGLFDGPDTSQTSGSRSSSSVAAQALFLMNSPYVSEISEAFAKRIQQSESSPEKRVSLAYQLALSRDSTEQENDEALQYIAAYRKQYLIEHDDPQDIETRQWSSLCSILLTSNEFFIID